MPTHENEKYILSPAKDLLRCYSVRTIFWSPKTGGYLDSLQAILHVSWSHSESVCTVPP